MTRPRLSLPVMQESPVFCVLPWVHICASVDGVWGRCCVDSSMYYEHYYGMEEEPEFTLREDSLGCSAKSRYARSNPRKTLNLPEAFNSEAMRSTRAAMMSGERVAACQYCYDREAAGGESYRQKMNKLFNTLTHVRQLIRRTSPDGYLNEFPCYLDLRFGNNCNLKCIMCGFPVSSGWGSKTKWSGSKIDPYSDDQELWGVLEQGVSKLRRVYFAGGEPFLQPLHFKLLDLILKSGHSKDVDLVYNSNLTVLPAGIFDKLGQFKSVEIGASCDGVGPVFESIRVGAKWESFVRNVRTAKRYVRVRIAVTPQRDNIAHLEELIEWARAESVEIDLTNILMYPKRLCIRSLPPAEKLLIREKYETLISRYSQDGRKRIAEELKMILYFMSS
jgi:sulfatase maturation enzyme AslB (radical SAM superfamily)